MKDLIPIRTDYIDVFPSKKVKSSEEIRMEKSLQEIRKIYEGPNSSPFLI